MDLPLDLHFSCGILGFEDIKDYKLHGMVDLEPFFWMEGLKEAKQSFLLVPPSHVVESYSVELSQEDADILNLSDPEDALILNIVTFGPDQSMTVNLKGPLVINRHTMMARQVVPRNASVLPTTFPLNN